MYVDRISKGFVYIIGLNILQFLIGLSFYSVAAKILNPTDLGIISSLTFIYSIFVVVVPLALPVAATKYVAEYIGRGEIEKASNVASSVIKLVLKISVIFLIFSYLGYVIILLRFEGGYSSAFFIMVTLVASFAAVIRLTYLALLQGLQRFDRFVISNSSTAIVSRLASLALILSGFSLNGFALGTFFGELFGLVLTMICYRGLLPRAKDSYPSKLLLSFSLPVYTSNVSNVLSDWADRILLLAVSFNLAALGVYELVLKGIGLLSVIWGTIDVILLPVFSEAYGQLGTAKLTPLLKKALRYLSFLFFPAALGLASISESLMILLFGLEYANGGLPLALISVFSIFAAFSIIMSSTLKSIGETRFFIFVSIFSVIADSSLVVILAPSLGIFGAIAGRIAVYIITFIFIYSKLRSRISLEVDIRGLWKSFLASLFLVVVVKLFQNVYMSLYTSPVFVVVEIGLGLATYILGLALLRALNSEDFILLRKMLPKKLSKTISLFEKILVR
ncbi:MAG: Polysacc synt protein [Thermoproteota archaeon]|nr:Polysacc synt protein [Thermoproteota archaeon]